MDQSHRYRPIARFSAAPLHGLLIVGRQFSVPGLLIATLFFAASLTPSLIPRTPMMQGVLSGVSVAAGYGVGVLGHWLWAYLELPEPDERVEAIIALVVGAVCVAIALAFLWQASTWQNSIRFLMGLGPVHSAHPLQVAGIAAAVFIALNLVSRLFHLIMFLVSGWLRRHIPSRISHILGLAVAVALFASLIDGVLIRYGLRFADATYQKFDALVEADVAPPRNPVRTGSDASLLDWDDLGRAGRQFVSWGPRSGRLSAFHGVPTLDPVRVYVGLNSADTVKGRVALALAELKRARAFERSVLVIITPSGTGQVEEGAINTLEYLHRGDVASVAVQYSYLASWLSLLVEPDYGAETARALFNEVYDYWTQLPKDDRPKLYLFGVSLGALNSQLSTDIYDVVGDPYQGALWAGTPFSSEKWQNITEDRDPRSPAWLPRFRDGSAIRFTNQWDHLDIPGATWGPMRLVFLQYASDPVAFFDPAALYREPPWLHPKRGPDVSPKLRWYPIVTFLQLVVDLASATEVPLGYGHRYHPDDFINAWIEVSAPQGWTTADIERLKALYAHWK